MQKALRVSFPVLLSVLAFGAAAPFALAMTTPGTVTSSPTQAMSEGIGTSWSLASINNSLLVDGIPAQTSTIPAGTASQSLVLTGFNFNVPTNATITGVELSVTRRSPVGSGTSLQDSTIALVGGFGTSTSLATTDPWPTALSAAVYGGSANTWGVGLTPSEVNSANFGVAIAVQNTDTGGHGAYVDGATITVYYTTSAPATLEVGAGKPYATIQSAITAAESGDTVSIAAGTYTENVEIFNKSNLTIQGAGQGDNGTIIAGDGTGIAIKTSSGITIKNLKIHTVGANKPGIWIYGWTKGGTASNNLKVQDTTIVVEGYSPGIVGDSVTTVAHSGWLIGGEGHGNTIQINNSGVGLTDAGDGIDLQDVTNSEVSYNSITIPTTSTGSTNVLWSSEAVPLTNLVFKNNIVSGSTGSEVSVLTDYNGGFVPVENPPVSGSIATVQIQGNTFSNWGTKALNLGANVTGIAINSNTFEMTKDTSLVIGGVATDKTGTGNVFNVSSPAKIQTAVTAAFSGDTINVAAGTYNNVQLTGSYNSNITVVGNSAADTTINGLDLSGSTFNGLTFRNFTFAGDSPGYRGFSVTIASDGSYGNLAFENDTFNGQSAANRGAIFLNRGFNGFTLRNDIFQNYNGSSYGAVYSVVFAEAQSSTWGGNFTATGNSLSNSTAKNFLETYRWKDVSFTHNDVNAVGGRLLVWSDTQRGPLESLGTVSISNNTINVQQGMGIEVYNALDTTANVASNNISSASNCVMLDSVSTTNTSRNTMSGCSTGLLLAANGTTMPIAATVTNNAFVGNTTAALNDDLTAITINASQNYWDNVSGPIVGTTIIGAGKLNVSYAPWYTDALLTTLTTGTPNTSGSQASTTIPVAVTQTGTSDGVTVTAVIPANTVITGNVSWDGTIAAPTATTASVTIPGYSTAVTSAVAIGSSDTDLTFDKAVKLTFAGQAGKRVGWYDHAGAFSEITTACTGTNDEPTQTASLAASGACKINDDGAGNLVVWTKHFSTFTTYSSTVATPVISPNGAVFHGFVNVTMDDSTAPATIRYSIDGTDPICDGNLGYANGQVFTFSNSTTLKAIRCDGVSSSAIASAIFNPAGGNGGGNGGGGGGAISATPATPATPAVPTVSPATPATPATPAARGRVLGAEAYNFTKDLHMGSTGADVTELQKLLIASGFDIPAITKGGVAYGTFGGQTLSAVIAYQKAHGVSPARGYVSTLTRAELNKGNATTTPATGKTNLTASQANSILSLLQSFGAETAVVAKVKAALGQ